MERAQRGTARCRSTDKPTPLELLGERRRAGNPYPCNIPVSADEPVAGGGAMANQGTRSQETGQVLEGVQRQSLARRWNREYLTALRERHNLAHKESKFQPKPGDAVLVRTDNKNRGKWPLAIVQETYPGKDGIVRAVRLKTSHGTLERPVQHLYPMELTCDVTQAVQLNPEAPSFGPRPRRDAAAAASLRVQQIADTEQ